MRVANNNDTIDPNADGDYTLMIGGGDALFRPPWSVDCELGDVRGGHAGRYACVCGVRVAGLVPHSRRNRDIPS